LKKTELEKISPGFPAAGVETNEFSGGRGLRNLKRMREMEARKRGHKLKKQV